MLIIQRTTRKTKQIWFQHIMTKMTHSSCKNNASNNLYVVVFCIGVQIYDAAVRWLKYDVCNRQQYMVEVLGCVRFPLVSKTFLSKTVQAEPLIQDDPKCLKMVISK